MLAVVIGAIVCATYRIGDVFFQWIERHPGSDKVGHFVLLGTLAFSLNLALRGKSLQCGPGRLLWGSLLVAVVITFEEFSQMWVSTRQFDWGDLAANYAGIACADWLVRRWLR